MKNMRYMNRQGGAVAVIVGISIFLLVGFLAMVIDLGHLYIAKTELQNGADAAALAGAKELNGTAAGVASAVAMAQNLAGKNNYDFANKKIYDTTDSETQNDVIDIWVGSSPNDTYMVLASTVTDNATAANKTFVKVHTRNRDMIAWFAPIWNIFHVSTYGIAVAGKYTVDITPVAICELPDDPANPYDNELGFERGVGYKVSDANPLGPGTMFWIDPTATAPGTCSANTTDSLPYICAGKVGFTPVVGQDVYTNTGISDPQLEALDSRFGLDNPSKSKCELATAPPDTNVKQYRYNDSGAGSPRSWMEPDPIRQGIRFVEIDDVNRPVPRASRTFADYGVLWSASRTDGMAVSDWSTLYPGGAATSYPEPSPYAQTSGSFFDQPPAARRPGVQGRRFLNIVIVSCPTPGGVCRPAMVRGVGKFFMQRQANLPTDKDIYVEFTGLLPMPLPPADIRLYR